ncbi:thioredoxin domain-containing protein [Ditylenchus destructor]|uniref:Thioredoxin domain-containing protein n=1 Tax=Ditylenchus destructor TaxID=166010 RepID=A0AAD4NIM4_9BILA|nr:thioredoxin domain-containing protein [Ditylenchus destructor]
MNVIQSVSAIDKYLLCYHVVNGLSSLSFIASKLLKPICHRMYGDEFEKCVFSSREHELLVFIGVIIVWKNRKSLNWRHYLSTIYFYSKFANAFLFFRISAIYGILYSLFAIATYVIFPEPVQVDSDKIVYFRTGELQREMDNDKSVVWVIEFFNTWSAECRHVAPVFSKLADKYTLHNLKFAKVDVGKYPKEGEHFRLNTHPMSKQIPSISVFKGGVQINRRPAIGANSRVISFVFNEENCVRELDLHNIYAECKAKPSKERKKDK